VGNGLCASGDQWVTAAWTAGTVLDMFVLLPAAAARANGGRAAFNRTLEE
jgi:hypothetical protein